MNSQFYLDEVSFFDVGGVFLEGSIVAADLVDGDGGGEGEALEGRFFVIDLGQFIVDLAVRIQAEFVGLGAYSQLLQQPTEHFISDFSRNLVLFNDSRSAKGLLLFTLVSLHVQQVLWTN